MLHDELIERGRRRDEDRARASRSSSGAACPLPGRSNRSGIAGHDAGIERTNVDPEFECICGYNAKNAAVAQTAFNFAPLSRQVASTVTAYGFRLARLRRVRLLQVGQYHFGVQSAVCEHNRLQLPAKDLFCDSCRFVNVAAPNPEISVHHWRVVEHEKLLASRCPVLFDNFDFFLNKLRSQLAGVRNRCGTADELRIRAIELRNTPQSPQDICKMAPEHAAVRVQVIEHDVA